MVEKKDWQLLALDQRSKNNEAIAEAHADASDYGSGWLKVDALGNLTRVNPKDITIIYNKEGITK